MVQFKGDWFVCSRGLVRIGTGGAEGRQGLIIPAEFFQGSNETRVAGGSWKSPGLPPGLNACRLPEGRLCSCEAAAIPISSSAYLHTADSDKYTTNEQANLQYKRQNSCSYRWQC